jgi:hypothetical protein
MLILINLERRPSIEAPGKTNPAPRYDLLGEGSNARVMPVVGAILLQYSR